MYLYICVHTLDPETSVFGPWPFLLEVSLIRFPTTIPMHHHFVVLEVVLFELPTSMVDPNIPR